MNRYAKDRRSTGPRPVERVELSEKHIGLRIALVILCILIAAGAFAYAIGSWLSTDPGWALVTASSTGGIHCGEDFAFYYNFGAAGTDPTVERKRVTELYTRLAIKAYQQFTSDEGWEDGHNVYYINAHPGEEITVDPCLYTAFSALEAAGDRGLYLGPLYEEYTCLLATATDIEAAAYDPRLNADVAAWHKTVAEYAADPDAITLELLGDNTVRLTLSEEYRAFGAANGITAYLDFGWMKNAFILDFFADELAHAGLTNGVIQSYDGFGRALCETSCSAGLYQRTPEGAVAAIGCVDYDGPRSVVCLRDFFVGEEVAPYRLLDSGEIRVPYLDAADGFGRASLPELLCLSKGGCADLLLRVKPAYATEVFDPSVLPAWESAGITAVRSEGDRLFLTGTDAVITPAQGYIVAP